MKDAPLSKDTVGRVADRLTVLLGVAGLLRDGAFGAVTDRQKQALMEIIQNSEEMSVLLRPLFNSPELNKR